MDCMNKEKSGEEKLRIVFGDAVLGIHKNGFDYLFSYQTGGLESLVTDGREWLYRTPKPTFWRAVTDNDKGNHFPFWSAMWLGADLFLETEKISVWVDGEKVKHNFAPDNNRFREEVHADEVKIKYTYRTATSPPTKVKVLYTVDSWGRIRVDVHYCGKKGLPGETYPDRMAGGVKGNYQIDGLPVTPYLTPQDCGMHMKTEELTVTRSSVLANEDRERRPFSLKFTMADAPFAFTCLPYTAEELENAAHQEELPPARRTVVCILGAVRGVGGIDSWGSDVGSGFHIDGERDIRFSFCIEGE